MDKTTLRQVALKHQSEIMQPYDAIMDLQGFDAICAFAEYLGGTTVYIPNLKTIFAKCLALEAKRHFDGQNYYELCRRYGISERQLRRILAP